MVDSEMGGGWFVEIYQKLKRKHDPTLVGCWCAAWDALTLRSLDFCENLYEVALLAKETKWVPFGPYGNAALDAVIWLSAWLGVLCVLPTFLWQAAWLMPLSLLAAARVCWMSRMYDREGSFSDRLAAISAERKALQNVLQDNDSLEEGLTKLLLAGVSAVVVWVACVCQLGSHSLGGWVLASLLPLWLVVEWLWGVGLWRPPSWYPVQLLYGGIHSLYCFDAGATAMTHRRHCTHALSLPQVITTGGGYAALCSYALSFLWHMGGCWDINWRNIDVLTGTAAQRLAGRAAAQEGRAHLLPPWWHAAAAGMLPSIARSWLLLLSHCAGPQAALIAMGGGVEAAVVLLARGLGCALSVMQAGVRLLSWPCRYSLASLPAGLLLGEQTAHVAGLASRLGLWCVQRAAGVVMGVLCWAAPAWYVGPLVQRACAASGVWQEGCLELLQPYAAQASDSLSLSQPWWFTIIVHVWVGCILRQLMAVWTGGTGNRWLREERQHKLEVARQRKEQKVQQRRQQKKHY